eukprot:6186550-Pleurochrysis_carterae.AAC.2
MECCTLHAGSLLQKPATIKGGKMSLVGPNVRGFAEAHPRGGRVQRDAARRLPFGSAIGLELSGSIKRFEAPRRRGAVALALTGGARPKRSAERGARAECGGVSRRGAGCTVARRVESGVASIAREVDSRRTRVALSAGRVELMWRNVRHVIRSVGRLLWPRRLQARQRRVESADDGREDSTQRELQHSRHWLLPRRDALATQRAVREPAGVANTLGARPVVGVEPRVAEHTVHHSDGVGGEVLGEEDEHRVARVGRRPGVQHDEAGLSAEGHAGRGDPTPHRRGRGRLAPQRHPCVHEHALEAGLADAAAADVRVALPAAHLSQAVRISRAHDRRRISQDDDQPCAGEQPAHEPWNVLLDAEGLARAVMLHTCVPRRLLKSESPADAAQRHPKKGGVLWPM